MGFSKDLWFTTTAANGLSVRRQTKRHGKGKRWLACWTDPHGRERSKAFDRKIDADRHWKAQQTDVARGDYIDAAAGKVRFDEIARRWLSSRLIDPATAVKYERSYRLQVEPEFGRREVGAIRPSEIQTWLAALVQRYGPSTARAAFLVLLGTLELAVADESIKKNPAKSKVVKRPAYPREDVQAWDDATVRKLIDGHPEEFRAIPTIGASCGLRQGEIYGLALEDIDFDEKVLRVRRQVKKLGPEFVFALPKNDRERTVPLPEWAAQTLRTHIAKRRPAPYTLPWEQLDGKPRTVRLLFRWTDDRHIRSRTFDELVWKPALVKAGIIPKPTKDVRGRPRYATDRTTGLHALRHYYASVTLADGVSVKELAAYLGHHDPGFTLRVYSHMIPSSHGRARAAIDARMLRPRVGSDGTPTEQGQ